MKKKLTFIENEALKCSAIDKDLYRVIKEKLEEGVSGSQSSQLVWDPAYGAFLINNP